MCIVNSRRGHYYSSVAGKLLVLISYLSAIDRRNGTRMRNIEIDEANDKNIIRWSQKNTVSNGIDWNENRKNK